MAAIYICDHTKCGSTRSLWSLVEPVNQSESSHVAGINILTESRRRLNLRVGRVAPKEDTACIRHEFLSSGRLAEAFASRQPAPCQMRGISMRIDKISMMLKQEDPC